MSDNELSSAEAAKRREEAVMEHRAVTAEEFLSCFPMRRDLWGSDPSAWIFRGHAQSDWQLYASAHRGGELEKFLRAERRTDDKSPTFDTKKFIELFDRFRSALDDAGLEIPFATPDPTKGSSTSFGTEVE